MFDFNSLVAYCKASRETVTDDVALKAKELYPIWSEGVEITQDMIDKGQNRYQYGDKLYKVIQPHTTQADWTPDITASLFEVIDVQHEGTLEDPIPWSKNMQCYEGKYYTYEGVLYRCTRDSGIALGYTPEEVLGQYFELV